MKKLLSLVFALLLICTSAFALNGANYPAWDGVSAPAESLYGSIGGQSLLMEFDPSAEYSTIADGLMQICFFAFAADETTYLELFLKIPENVAGGDVLTSSDLSNAASVSVYEVYNKDTEDFYFASQVMGIAYPVNSSYEIRIDRVERSAETLAVSGTLNARLLRMESMVPSEEALDLSGLHFSFTLPLSGASVPQQPAPAQPEATKEPQPSAQPPVLPAPEATKPPQKPQLPAPRTTMDPHPAFTLPPDYAVI